MAKETVNGQPLWATETFKGQGQYRDVTMTVTGRHLYVCTIHENAPANMRGYVNVTDMTSTSSSTTTKPPGPVDQTSTFYFAEGTVRPGFQEYITLQNPGAAGEPDASAVLSFQASDDSGAAVAVPSLTVGLPAQSRKTVDINAYVADKGVPTPLNVSVQVTGDRPLVAERPLYFSTSLAGGADGGSDVIGAREPAASFSFAEGTVRPGFQEYLTLQNPLTGTARATVTFQGSDDSGASVPVPTLTFDIPGNTRVTKDVTAYITDKGVPTPLNLAARVTADKPIVVERPLYFHTDLAGGADGGTTVIGATAT